METSMNRLKKAFFLPLLGFFLICPLNASGKGDPGTPAIISPSWSELHLAEAKCKVHFPQDPQHLYETLAISELQQLRCDVYISSSQADCAFMLLIAQYPTSIEQYAQMGLESFLNGILSHSSRNQLLFADLFVFNGHAALDFFIQTGQVYFKGRAFMVENNLYLMAMECEVQNYSEEDYHRFINSFELFP
jgi:hypothetical protein